MADEGLELTVTNGFGADKVMTALISGDADIGFMGSESSIYVYAEGSDDYAVNFAGLQTFQFLSEEKLYRYL